MCYSVLSAWSHKDDPPTRSAVNRWSPPVAQTTSETYLWTSIYKCKKGKTLRCLERLLYKCAARAREAEETVSRRLSHTRTITIPVNCEPRRWSNKTLGKQKKKKNPRWVQIMAGVFSFYGWIIEAPTIKLTWEGADSLFPPRDGGTGPMLASTCNLKRFGSRWWWKDWKWAFKKNKKTDG